MNSRHAKIREAHLAVTVSKSHGHLHKNERSVLASPPEILASPREEYVMGCRNGYRYQRMIAACGFFYTGIRPAGEDWIGSPDVPVG